MNPVVTYIGLAVVLMIGGLLICYLSPSAKYPLAVAIAWWIGFLVFLCGALLILAKIILWVAGVLQSMLGVG